MARTTDHEARLRILVGPSSYPDRRFTVWTRDNENEPPKKLRRYTTNQAKEIFLPLTTRQIIIADSSRGHQPQPIDGEVFVIAKHPKGLLVNDAFITEARGYMPPRLASRDLHFDIVSAEVASLVSRPRRRGQLLQFLR